MINRLVRLFIQDCDNVTDPAVREKYGGRWGLCSICCCLRASSSPAL